MSGGGSSWDNGYPWYANLGALLIVVLFSLCGGAVAAVLNGFNIGKIKWKPLLGSVKIPALVVMILFGAVGRNFWSWERNAYNDTWATYIRMFCLMVILLRGGLELSFAGKGLIVFLYTFVPQLVEATSVMLVSYFIVGLPFAPSYALGFVCAAVSPAVLVPSMLSLAKRGLGVEKGIPTTLIAASSFDDIGAITLFGVFMTISLNGKTGDEANVYLAVLANVY